LFISNFKNEKHSLKTKLKKLNIKIKKSENVKSKEEKKRKIISLKIQNKFLMNLNWIIVN
jgi:hypothetical protein